MNSEPSLFPLMVGLFGVSVLWYAIVVQVPEHFRAWGRSILWKARDRAWAAGMISNELPREHALEVVQRCETLIGLSNMLSLPQLLGFYLSGDDQSRVERRLFSDDRELGSSQKKLLKELRSEYEMALAIVIFPGSFTGLLLISAIIMVFAISAGIKVSLGKAMSFAKRKAINSAPFEILASPGRSMRELEELAC